MRRPPRRAAQKLLDVRALLSGLGTGAVAFAVVAAMWWLARGAGLTHGQVAATCFIALVVGNLALIALTRHSASVRELFANPAFLAVTIPALLLLALVTSLPTPAQWFGFAPPPWRWAALAALAPVLVLAVAAWLARLLSRADT